MKTKTQKVLPKILHGTIHIQYMKCGKSNCKCARGELHGAYFYLFQRVNGKLKKYYLKPSEVEAVRVACQARQIERRKRIESGRLDKQKYRSIREQIRDIKNQI